MNDLRPLFETSESPRTRALLGAGRTDTAPAGFSDRLLVGLGLSVAVSGVSVTAAASTAAAAGAASKGSGAATLIWVAAKWVAVGALGGGILAGGLELASSARDAPKELAGAVRPRPPTPPARSIEQFPTETPVPDAPPLTPLEAQPEPSTPPERVAPAPHGQLGREARIIDRARHALAAGNPQRALAHLDDFERLAETGVLDREAKILRIDALLRAGQAGRARELARQYLKVYPNDAHSARLRALQQPAAP